MKALSIRQPWAWFILHANPWKNIENRTWPTEFRGNFLIHAAKSMTIAEFDEACSFAVKCGVGILPQFDLLPRGGIVGVAELSACITESKSKWFTGPHGFVLTNPYPLPFQPCKGALGFFELPL